MRTNISGTKLEIDLYDLVEELDSATLLSLADAVAVQDDVIKYVVQQILDGWTDLDSRGGLLCAAGPLPTRGLDWAIREIAKRSGEVAAKEVKRLETAMKKLDEDNDRLRDELRTKKVWV